MLYAKSGDKGQVVGGLIGFGGFLVVSGIKRALKTRKVQDTARHRIAYAPQGNVEVEGFAWSFDQPFRNSAGEYCAYYTCVLQEQVGSGKNRRWVDRWTYIYANEFVVVDATGGILVQTPKADVTCREETVAWSWLTGRSNGAAISALVQGGYGGTISTGWFGGTYRLVEKAIRLGSPCYLQGRFDSAGMSSARIPNEHVESFFHYVSKSLTGEVHRNLKFDQNRDGEVSSEEAAYALQRVAVSVMGAAQNSAGLAVASVPGEKKALKVFGRMFHDADHALMIADMHEHHLLKNVGSLNLLRIIGGAAMVGMGVLLLMAT